MVFDQSLPDFLSVCHGLKLSDLFALSIVVLLEPLDGGEILTMLDETTPEFIPDPIQDPLSAGSEALEGFDDVLSDELDPILAELDLLGDVGAHLLPGLVGGVRDDEPIGVFTGQLAVEVSLASDEPGELMLVLLLDLTAFPEEVGVRIGLVEQDGVGGEEVLGSRRVGHQGGGHDGERPAGEYGRRGGG